MMNTIVRYWLKPSTYNTVVGIYATLPFIMAPACFVVNAPYGRFAGKFGIDFSINGKWGWFIMEVISPIMFSLSLLFTRPTFTPFQIITTTAWLIHYVNRSMIYPYRATSMAPIHILPFLLSIFFSVINGYTNGMWIGRHSNSIYQGQFWIGMIIWAGGFLSNVYHDNLLFKLRVKNAAKQKEQEQEQDKKKRYFVPTGGLFEYISCPNYFSESVEWLGYSIATGSSFPAWIFLISTAANLWPRAYRTHQWYKNEFRNYPKERKAVIPFIY